MMTKSVIREVSEKEYVIAKVSATLKTPICGERLHYIRENWYAWYNDCITDERRYKNLDKMVYESIEGITITH